MAAPPNSSTARVQTVDTSAPNNPVQVFTPDIITPPPINTILTPAPSGRHVNLPRSEVLPDSPSRVQQAEPEPQPELSDVEAPDFTESEPDMPILSSDFEPAAPVFSPTLPPESNSDTDKSSNTVLIIVISITIVAVFSGVIRFAAKKKSIKG
jgi:hypothetical protein